LAVWFGANLVLPPPADSLLLGCLPRVPAGGTELPGGSRALTAGSTAVTGGSTVVTAG